VSARQLLTDKVCLAYAPHLSDRHALSSCYKPRIFKRGLNVASGVSHRPALCSLGGIECDAAQRYDRCMLHVAMRSSLHPATEIGL
jgi:hypothetical protein